MGLVEYWGILLSPYQGRIKDLSPYQGLKSLLRPYSGLIKVQGLAESLGEITILIRRVAIPLRHNHHHVWSAICANQVRFAGLLH
jgi:DNA-binding IclR family transcriptional regulator